MSFGRVLAQAAIRRALLLAETSKPYCQTVDPNLAGNE